MKSSPLERLAALRRQQLDAGKAKLARLRNQRDDYESEIRLAAADSIDARDQALRRTQADGGSLTALQDYLDFLEIRQNRSAQSAASLEQEIAQQSAVVLTARREVEIARRLLDKHRRLEQLRTNRIQQAQLDDWFLTGLLRRRREPSP